MNFTASYKENFNDFFAAPSVAEMEELLSNIRLNRSDVFTDDGSLNNYFTGKTWTFCKLDLLYIGRSVISTFCELIVLQIGPCANLRFATAGYYTKLKYMSICCHYII